MVDFARGGRCSDFSGMDILSGEIVGGGEGLAVVGVMPFLLAS